MNKKAMSVGLAALFGSVLVVAPVVLPAVAGATTGSGSAAAPTAQLPFSGTTQHVCSAAPAGYASCLAERIDHTGEQSHFSQFTTRFKPARGNSLVVSGLSPSQIEGVYGFSSASTAGTGQTVAIVDAYNDPTAAADLSTFSTQYGLPACTTTNGCFTQVSQTGTTSLPTTNGGWALEISLDVQWAHAIAPGAHILLVEASNNSDTNLYAAERYAAAHANYVSNSWGGSEYIGQTSDDSSFTSTSGNVSFFAATGDSGSSVEYPATSPNVVAVGGTSLSFGAGGVFSSESAWSQGGGGCSTIETAPSSQSALANRVGCGSHRSVPDVSLDADPNSGVAVYDTTPQSTGGATGWWTVGGTSVATPIWAAQAAVQGVHVTPQTAYTDSTLRYRDITSGSNGHAALVGYDLATGLGSWATNAAPAPGGLSATGGSGSVSLSWSSAAGATSYTIYRGTSAGKESVTPIATGVTGTTYNDTTVSSGTTYYYEVEGVDAAGNGSPSNEASSSSTGSSSSNQPPAAPSGLSAKAGTGQVSLTWSSSTGASSYQVLRGTSAGGESSTPAATNITTTTYTDTNVTAGTTYYYEVEAVNTNGSSGPSNESFATPTSGSSGGGGTSTPTASYTHSCSLSNCTFSSTSTDSGGTITTYAWSGAFSASGAKVQHTFSSQGTYSVTLTVTDNNGKTAKATGSLSCRLYGGRWLLCS